MPEHDAVPEPDPTLKPLALPVPALDSKMSADGQRWRVLPGAPLAFVKATEGPAPLVDLYADTATLGRWCREHGDFSPSVVSEIEDYFCGEAGQRVRSFASLPIRRPDKTSSLIGVLNIHANRTGLLRSIAIQLQGGGGAAPAEQFGFLVAPLLSILAQLLDFREPNAAEL